MAGTIDDDLRYTLMPNWLTDLWNYSTSNSFKLMATLLARGRFPKFAVLTGPPGSAKSAISYAIGRWSSCKTMASTADAPCGQCEGCRAVRYGGDEWITSSFREEAPAEYSNPEEATRAISAVLNHHWNHGLRPAWDGARSQPLVFLINEAHRLTKSQKAVLLTALEPLTDIYVLATTTDLKKMQIEPERVPKEDPLISRGEIFWFTLPTIAETVAGLRRDANRAGLRITEAAATWIAQRNVHSGDASRCMPRNCIADLGKLSAFTYEIDIAHCRLLEGNDTSVQLGDSSPAIDHSNFEDSLY